MVRQIGIAIGIPYEVLIKHYTASYSAARAALLDAWAFFQTMRADLVDNVCSIVYSVWMAQEVAQGTIAAPGFFASPMVRAAWLGGQWNGPSMKQINPKDEVEAARIRVEQGFTTRAEETAQMNGGDWETKHRQRVKEEQMRKEGGLTDVPTKVQKTIT
ncbi:MAG TPA: phage portal protein, partial [Nitrospiraceae bacterium]|nr:phage portal protein [Nitrospiraceae bacterium]